MGTAEHLPWTIRVVGMTMKITEAIWAIVRTISTTPHARDPRICQDPRINMALLAIIRLSRRGFTSTFTRATVSINLSSPCPCPCRHGIQLTLHHRAAFTHPQTINTPFHLHILTTNPRDLSITTTMTINIPMVLPCKDIKDHDQVIWMMICIRRTCTPTLQVGTNAYPDMPLFPPHPSIPDFRPRGLCGLQD